MLQPDFSVFPEIQTARLVLRKVTAKDAPEVFKLRSDEQVMQYIDKERAATVLDGEVFITRIILSLNNNDGITWAITLKENPQTLIGTIGYWRLIKEHYRAEIGYMLKPDYWKKGIMKEALEKVIEFGFNELKLHSIEAQINPENSPSAGILISNGFVKEAHFKEDYLFNGVFKDTVVFSRLQK